MIHWIQWNSFRKNSTDTWHNMSLLIREFVDNFTVNIVNKSRIFQGGVNPKGGRCQPVIWPNCVKMKKIGIWRRWGGGGRLRPKFYYVDPLLIAITISQVRGEWILFQGTSERHPQGREIQPHQRLQVQPLLRHHQWAGLPPLKERGARTPPLQELSHWL